MKSKSKDENRGRALRNTIKRVFTNSGFTYIPTRGKHKEFGHKDIEIDSIFLYQNIILFCEDTIAKHTTEHLRKTQESTQIIERHFPDVLDWLKITFAEQFAKNGEYSSNRYKQFYLYFTEDKVSADPRRFESLTIVEPKVLYYFDAISKAIKHSARYEIFRFLRLERKDIGQPESSSSEQKINANIIYPQDITGTNNGVRFVSFMMSPQKLIECGYVVRKDNWQSPNEVYQRLIEGARLKKIRRHIADTKQTFVNNVIVALPPTVHFENQNGDHIELDNVQDFHSQVTICIPEEFNSICIIDGQHRIFAYHEGLDALEPTISELRKKLHLLVTGIVFPPDMTESARARYSSQIFLNINSTAKNVSQEVLLYIEALKDSLSSTNIARRVLQGLNEKPIFLNAFRLSSLDNAKIKTTSIIRFALKKLVEIDGGNRESLFFHWRGDHNLLTPEKPFSEEVEHALDEYIDFVISTLACYFGAIKENREEDWNDDESKILSVTAINGFLITLRKTLPRFGVRDFQFYKEHFDDLTIPFGSLSQTKESRFPYASSQYNKMSDDVIDQCFPLSSEE